MDETILQEMLDELFSALESVETQNGAILQFLKDRGIASDQDLAPFLEKAGNTSNVRWRAVRARINHLLSSAAKTRERSQEKPQAAEPRNDEPERPAGETGKESRAGKDDDPDRPTVEPDRKAEGSTEKRAGKDAA